MELIKAVAEAGPSLIDRFWTRYKPSIPTWRDRNVFQDRMKGLAVFTESVSKLVTHGRHMPAIQTDINIM